MPTNEAPTAEELEAEFAGAAGQGSGGDPTAGGGAGAAGGQEPAPTPAPSGPAKVKVGEGEYDEAEIRQLIEFQEWAQAHQDQMNAFGSYLRGEAEFTVKGEQKPAPTEENDPYAAIEDEGLRERLRLQEQQLEALRQTQASQVTASSLQEAERGINRAYETMREKYGLSEDEVKELANATAQSGVLPGIRATQSDPYEAAVRALDYTYWSDEKYRNKAVEGEILRLDAHQQRQALAGAVGGSPGSVSREVPSDEEVAKMTPQEKASAMASEIAASFRGNT